MNSNFITIKHHLINLADLSLVQLKKKNICFHFGDFKISVNLKNAANSEKQFKKICELLKSTVLDIPVITKKSKNKKKKVKSEKAKDEKPKAEIIKP